MKKTILSKDKIKHIAKLANLSLGEKELQKYTEQLSSVLNYVEILRQFRTRNVPPTYQVLDETKNIFREDEIKESFSQKDALAQSKATHNGYFLARNVFEERETSTKILKHKKSCRWFLKWKRGGCRNQKG